MVGHAVYGKHLVFVIVNDGYNVFVQSFFPGITDYRIAVFNCKNALYMDLTVGIWHSNLFLGCPDGTKIINIVS
jgi:hypothetical protein